MKAYLAIKYHEDCKNRGLIEQISESLENAGLYPLVMIRDHEKWGEVKFASEELMKLSFRSIDESDVLVVEFSEKGVGLGIEAGYAHAKRKPIIVIAKRGSEISTTISGISKEVIFYDKPEELTEKFRALK